MGLANIQHVEERAVIGQLQPVNHAAHVVMTLHQPVLSNPLLMSVAGLSTGRETIACVRYPRVFLRNGGMYSCGTSERNQNPL